MKIWLQLLCILGVTGLMPVNASAAPASSSDASPAIRAIQQASDPSAVVAAYANGVATDRNDPKVLEAYTSRMVDLGLPELASHQAQTLTTLQSNNGLAWGVVAYVNARRGEMVEAISAINLAGAAAPENAFVQRTAGEIAAWYDLKADKTKLPDNAKNGLTKVRTRLEKEPAFTSAYNNAKDAYHAQAGSSQTTAPPAPSQNQSGYAPQAQPESAPLTPSGYAPAYYPDYYYAWGPSWVEPLPWWWWQPVGFFTGFDFFPFSTFVVFDEDDFFFHHHFFHHDHDDFFHHRFFDHARDDFFHSHSFHHNGLNVAFRDPNHAFFNRDGKSTFFGAAARPNSSVVQSAQANFNRAGAGVTGSLAMQSPVHSSLTSQTSMHSMPPRTTTSSSASGFGGMSQGFVNRNTQTRAFAPSMPWRSGATPQGAFSQGAFRTMPWAAPRFGGGMPWTAWSRPGLARGFARPGFGGPAFGMPRPSPRAMGMSRGFAGGGFRGGMMAGGSFAAGHR